MNTQITIEALFDLEKTLAAELFADKTYPWEALGEIRAFIFALGAKLPQDRYERVGEDVWIAKSASVAPSASLNGPLIIDEDAEVRHCAFIRGSAIVGKGAVVGNSTELKNCVLFDGVQVPHFNYVGDSVLGYKAHMGAGAVTSNVKSDKTNVEVHAEGGNMPTGLRKFGAMLGDHAEVGCNSVLNPGTIIGRESIVYPTSCVRGVVPSNSIYKGVRGIAQREKRG